MVEVKKINDFMWKIEKTGAMNVPVIIFASEKLLDKIKEDRTLIQASNMACLPGVIKNIVVCPDAHEGYGACIGGVAAHSIEEGVISPGEIGYDIDCSIRLLRTNLRQKDVRLKIKEIINSLFIAVPSGVGSKGRVQISEKELNNVLKNGARWAVEKGYGKKEDYEHSEEQGCMSRADHRFCF